MILSHRKLSDFAQSSSGSVAVVVAVAIFMMVLCAGVAIDMARAQMLQSKIQSALDASGLAAVATLASKPADITEVKWVQQQAQRYFRVNFPAGYLSTGDAITINTQMSADNNTFTFAAETPQGTSLMKIAGITSVNVGATAKVLRSPGGGGLELVLVMDNTGSMNYSLDTGENCGGCLSSKIVAVKSAANSLLDILYGAPNDTAKDLYVGVVPFAQSVNIGNHRVDWLSEGTYGKDAVAGIGPHGDWGPGGSWGGCVLARNAPYDTNDFNPSATYGAFDVFWYPPSPAEEVNAANWLTTAFGTYWNYNPTPPADTKKVYPIEGWRTHLGDGYYTYMSDLTPTTYGPNSTCPTPITPLSSSKTAVKIAINAMVGKGDTLTSEGMIWGWRLLSPNWRGYWGGEMDVNSMPLDYGTSQSNKVVVLMSDGVNSWKNYNYTAYEFLWYFTYRYTSIDLYMLGLEKKYNDGRIAVQKMIDDKTLSVCKDMKIRGITIYTIGFGKTDVPLDDPSRIDEDLLKKCATDEDHYFYAPTNEDLKTAFKQIGTSLVNLRISQ